MSHGDNTPRTRTIREVTQPGNPQNATDPLVGGDVSATLATRYRPKSFASLTGQQHVTKVLRRALLDRAVPQQILFSGGSGLGKTTLARILSAALLCTAAMGSRNDGDACGSCDSCLDVLSPGRHHPDVIEFDAASNGGKDEIREIAARAQLAPMRGPVKVYIIDEAHGLSGPGGQAFLKLLEEPPAHVVFMLCTTDPQKMLKTNRGRCVEFELLSPARAELVANLQRVCTSEGWSGNVVILERVVEATDSDLGVRGTLMTLAKLAGPLANGTDLDDEALSDVLGLAPRRMIANIFAAVDAADPLLVLDALTELRARASEATIRSAIIEHARNAWRASLIGGESSTAQQRFEQLAGAPNGAEFTELTLVRLSRPALDAPDVAAAQALVDQATATLDDLTRATAEARGIGTKLHETVRAAIAATPASGPAKPRTGRPPGRVEPATPTRPPAKVTGLGSAAQTQPDRTPSRPPATPSTPPAQVSTAPAATAVSPAPVAVIPSTSGVTTPVARLSPAGAQLIAAASPAPAALPSLLALCSVTITDEAVSVVAGTDLLERVQAFESVLRAAAGRLGLPLRIS